MRGYNQVLVANGDIPKMTVITPFSLWEYLRMPFGLKNAVQAFQRLMHQVTQGLRNVFVYLDDILIASEDAAQHMEDLHALFQ